MFGTHGPPFPRKSGEDGIYQGNIISKGNNGLGRFWPKRTYVHRLFLSLCFDYILVIKLKKDQ